jgi:hypothetical protein
MTPLEELTRDAAATQEAILRERGYLAVVRARLLARRRRRGPARAWLVAAALSAVAFLAMVALLISTWRAAPLTFTASGAPARPGQWLSTDGSEPLPLRFSDGTAVDLVAGSTGRVDQVDARGARILIERGLARVHVASRAGAHWELGVGPFEVLVVGTRFVVGWDATREVFHLSVEEGAVTVAGPELHGREVRAGEVVSVWLGRSAEGTLVRAGSRRGPIDDEMPEAPVAAGAREGHAARVARATAAAPAIEGPGRATTPIDLAAGGSGARSNAADAPLEAQGVEGGDGPEGAPPGWEALAREGRYAEALAAADSAGWDALLERATAGELILLGDTARLGSRPDRASQVYLRARQRYPGTEAAAASAFRLGRQAADATPDAAARWFQTYVAERPDGRYAQEALGRLVEAHLARGDREEARAAARSYLERFPAGPHARLARSVVAE